MVPGIKYIAAGFISDAEKLLVDFKKEKSKEFSVFVHFWKKYNFAAIFLGRSSTELQQFTQEIFQLTLRFFSMDDLLHQIGAVYMLYALFRNQIVEPPTKIRIILEQYKQFMNLRILAAKEKYISLHYILGYLIHHGFDFVAHPSLVGPRNSKHNMELEKTELHLDCLLKELHDNSTTLIKKKLAEEIQELSKSYDSLTKSIPVLQAVCKGGHDLKLDKHIKKLSKVMGIDGSDSDSTKEEEGIGSRRAQIKSKAYMSKTSFRQINPEEEAASDDSKRVTRSRTQQQSLCAKRKHSSENDEGVKVVKRRRRRRMRRPKEQRRTGRPRKGHEMERWFPEVFDSSEDEEIFHSKRRGPTARSGYIDGYVEQIIPCFAEEIAVSSSTSEEEEKNSDEFEVEENIDEHEEENMEGFKLENMEGSEEENMKGSEEENMKGSEEENMEGSEEENMEGSEEENMKGSEEENFEESGDENGEESGDENGEESGDENDEESEESVDEPQEVNID